MYTYIITFLIAAVLFKLGDFVKKNNRIYIDLFAILILCMIAGFRDESVGTDTAVYIQPLIGRAIDSNSFTQYRRSKWISNYALLNTSQYEIGYTVFIYAISHLFRSVVLTQTALQLLVVLPVYLALRLKGDVSIWFGMLVFMALFFNPSLNSNRQAIALSFMLLAFALWMKDKKIVALILLLIAFLFHNSTMISFIIFFIYEFVWHQKGAKDNGMTRFNFKNMLIALAAGLTIIILVNPVISLFRFFGLTRFVGYLNGYLYGHVRFMPNQIIKIMPPLIILLLSMKGFKDKKSEWTFYIVMMIYTMILCQFTSVNGMSGRISYYFNYFAIFAYPLACQENKYPRTCKVVMITYLAFYWWFYFVLLGGNATVPYRAIA